ncbi:MAG TPA: Ku protein [Ferrovibrio sp.]|uniref:non-homologous end joining protein Ku n=1 Tax=Ferrovibrio sp. TaxID=1917215 RepID=UPI002ED2E692
MATRKAAKKKAAGREKSRKAASRTENAEENGRSGDLSARSIWTGNLRLALVSVPVRLYPAVKGTAKISFHQVHKPSGKRIRYQKAVPGIGPVDTDEIVKGFEVSKDSYVLIDPEEIEAIKVEAKKTLDLVQFVEQSDIDPIWYEKPYYVAADGELAEEAYGVLRDALRSSKRIGLGQFVMRGREYVAALKPCGKGLLLETLRFADELRRAAPYFSDIADVVSDKELLSLALELIERKSAPFDPKRFKDNYTEAIRELVDAKIKHRKPVHIEEERAAGGAKVINLVEALRRSVKGADASGAGAKAHARRQAG